MIKTFYLSALLTAIISPFLFYTTANAGGHTSTAPETFKNSQKTDFHLKDSFGVRHSIEMIQPWFLDSTESAEPQFSSISPDGKHILLLTMQGRISEGKNHYSLWMYNSENLKKFAVSRGNSPKPSGTIIYQFSTDDFSHTYGDGLPLPIRKLRWLDAGNRIAFILAKDGDAGDVYTLDIPTGNLRRLTNAEGQVIDYAISTEGNVVVYLANVIRDCPVAFPEPEKVGQYAFSIHTGMCEYSGLAQRFPRQRMQVFKVPMTAPPGGSDTQAPVPISGLFTYVPHQPKLRLSPDGKWATLIASPHDKLPAHWKKYFPKIGGWDYLEIVGGSRQENSLAGEGFSMAPQFLLIDVEKGATEPLFDAPVGFRAVLSDSHWLPDSRSVILTHTHLPADSFSGIGNVPPAEKVHFVEYNVYEKRLEPFYSFDDPVTHQGIINTSVLTTELVDQDRLIVTVSNNPTRPGQSVIPTGGLDYRLFKKTSKGWKSGKLGSDGLAPDQRNSIAVTVGQDLNTPPDFYVAVPGGQQAVRLTDLNPQLREIRMPKVQAIQWIADDGKQWKGGLILPPAYDRSRIYPLVVQVHCFHDNQFFRDGSDPAETAPFAGRAMASAGFVVLHIPVLPDDWDSTIEFESPQGRGIFLHGLRSVIQKLASEQLVDPERIGIVGWSAGGRLAIEAITKTDLNIKAAVVGDAAAYGPLTYFLMAGWPVDLAKTIETSTGGYPWGDGKQKWIENNPVYLLDKTQAALRIEAYDRATSIIWYDVLTVMKKLKKPVEYYIYDGAAHALLNPVQRYISSQGTIDWMRFWLLGEEDSDPKKNEQYYSWRRLRDQSANSGQSHHTASTTVH